MHKTERLNKNISRWASYRPEAAALVAKIPNEEVQFRQSVSGADNLCKEVGGQTFFYHSLDDPFEEAVLWFSQRPYNQVETLFIYGIGLGYYYKAAQKWLKANKRHSLVFIEDDPQVIRAFFSTETASDFLYDPQVFLDYLPMDKDFLRNLEALTLIYSFRKFDVSALQSYLQKDSYPKLKSFIQFFCVSAKKVTSEYISGSSAFYSNFILNMLGLSSSFQAEQMFGLFKGIPAIICGAGPSLAKNIELIGSLKDRAMIFAGGSALNALNAHGIDPHFGLGVDPNPAQMTRLISNQAYETPFFYRTRMHHEALNMVHGDKIFVAKNGGHQISEWFEEQLGLIGSDIPQGHNVLNLSLSMAKLLGCNPILVAGADLAYSEGQSYTAGIVNHPIHDLKEDFRTKRADDELLRKTDIYGRPTDTTWKWVNESLWYYQIAQKNPDLNIINVTEGGIGFPHIDNMTLQEAAGLFLPAPSDILARVAGAIQNSAMPPFVNREKVVHVIGVFIASLERCIAHCENISALIDKLRRMQMAQRKKNFEVPDKELLRQWDREEKSLLQEDAYVNDLEEYNNAYIRAIAIDLQRLFFDKGIKKEEEIRQEKLAIDRQRYRSLAQNAALHIKLMNHCLARDNHLQEGLKKWSEEQGKEECEAAAKEYAIPKAAVNERYSYENGMLIIEDPEMGISFQDDSLARSSKQEIKYSSGGLQMVSYYKEGVLHGPSIAYAENGTELVRSWFWQGKREGKMQTHYKSGRVHSLQRFRNGQLDGRQQYFYENGLPKTVMNYSKGVLDGGVILWHSSGRKARQLHFTAGKRHGVERFWDKSGFLRIEASYDNGKPVGIAKTWHDNGVLEKEVVYDESSHRRDVKMWDKEGHVLASGCMEKSDYFDDITGQVLKLTDSLDTVYHQIMQMVPIIDAHTHTPEEKKTDESFSADMEELRREMEHLQSLTGSLKEEAAIGQGRHSEALWKTPSAQHKLEKQIEALNQVMGKGLSDIQEGFRDLVKKVRESGKGDS